MPSESSVFTTRVDPISPPRIRSGDRRSLVEAPGTAPGSAMPIPQAVYRHSRFPDRLNIGACCLRKKRRVRKIAGGYRFWRCVNASSLARSTGYVQSPRRRCASRVVAPRKQSRSSRSGTQPGEDSNSKVFVPTAAARAAVAFPTDRTRSSDASSAASASRSSRRSRS